MNPSHYQSVPSEHDFPHETHTERVPKIQAFDLDNGHHTNGLPTRTTTRRPIRHAVHVNWVFEVICWLFALGCFVAIAAILFSFDGHAVPNWKYGITLATVVSLLSSGATFALVVPLEAGMGQIKWLWFRKARPIADFESIDSAAMGPPGSAKLLVTGKGGILAWFGALLIVLVLAIAPFVQQIITSDFRSYPNPGSSSIPIAHSYLNQSQSSKDVELSMKAAIMSGLLSTGNTSDLWSTPRNCPTGNCTFPSFTTLGVCGTCADLTSSLLIQNVTQDGYVVPGTNYSLPNGQYLYKDPSVFAVSMSISNTGSNSTNTIAFNSSYGFEEDNPMMPLADIFVIVGQYDFDGTSSAADLTSGPYASECILELCIKNFTAAEINGTLLETLVGTPVRFNSSQRDVTGGPDGAPIYWTTDQGLNYTIGDDTMNAFWTYFINIFVANVAQYNSASPQTEWPNDIAQALFVHLNSTPHTLDSTFNNIADSMTLKMRTEAGAGLIRGDALYQQAIVVIRWPWITLPLALLVLALVFLVVVAVQTRLARLEPWKTGALPTLFALQRLHSKDEMEQKAKQIYVRLDTHDQGHYLQTVNK